MKCKRFNSIPSWFGCREYDNSWHYFYTKKWNIYIAGFNLYESCGGIIYSWSIGWTVRISQKKHKVRWKGYYKEDITNLWSDAGPTVA